jgi:hypothetical protein
VCLQDPRLQPLQQFWASLVAELQQQLSGTQQLRLLHPLYWSEIVLDTVFELSGKVAPLGSQLSRAQCMLLHLHRFHIYQLLVWLQCGLHGTCALSFASSAS